MTNKPTDQMTTQTISPSDLMTQIARMATIEESSQVRNTMLSFKTYASADDYETVRRALSKRLNELADQSEADLQDTANMLRISGVDYNLSEWLTITEYAKKHSMTTQVVTNNIRRGNIPANCIIEIPILNNIRMVKDQPYR